MPRLYCPSPQIIAKQIILGDNNQVHHIKDVLRLKIGEEVTIFDDCGSEYLCRAKELLKDEIILEIKSKRGSSRIKRAKLTIACAIPKNAKIEDIIDKLTQLGVDTIIPLITERVIVKITQHKQADKLARWRKISQSAAEQSQRNSLLVIEPVKQIKELLAEAKKYDLKLIPTLAGNRKSLKEICGLMAEVKNILVLIGPEGDFTPHEVSLAIKAGFIPVSLGDLVLRVDTAAVAVASFIKFCD